MDKENTNHNSLQETAGEQHTAKYKNRSIVNNSAKMKKIYDLVEVVAPIDVSIHITGEDGCGKDRLAEYIHSQSSRTGNFVIVNPVELNDVVGSLGFSKVYDYFKKAEKGTVYISDIASANAKLQEYLLNSIIKIEQELGMYSPRFISSTNRNLTELSRQQRFNQRLRDSFAIIINIPPLRERKEDIEDLIRIIMRDLGYFGKKSIPIYEDAKEALQSYDWPGNVRQLVNTIYHAVNHTSSGMIVLSSLPKDVRRKHGFIEAGRNTLDELYKFARGLLESGIHSEAINPYEEYCKAIERPLIQAALDMTKGNRSQAAQLIRINRNTLHKKIQHYDMED
ncbi:MAG: sigma 54-interacting transcriptional regulator [Mucispirillum sp.]|nr:sigma 54-interacting transcriptional regulator [Mucispirillum sp.]